jgi:hypothetical protein
MPLNYLYGAIAGEAGNHFGGFVDNLLRLPWPVFRVLGGLTAGILAVTALIAWAFAIWTITGGVLGFAVNRAWRLLQRNPRESR